MTMIKRKNRQCRPLNQCCDRAYSAGKGLCMLHEDGGGGWRWGWGWVVNEWTVAQSNRNVIEAHEGSLRRYRFWGRAAGQVGAGAAVAVAVGAEVGKGDGRPMVSSFKCWLSVCRLVAFFVCGFRFWGQSEATNCWVEPREMGEGRGGVALEIALRKLRRRSRWHRWLRFVPLQRQIGNWELKWMRYKR